MTSTSRTAGCGPACPVVWQGWRGNSPPYADPGQIGGGLFEVDDEGGELSVAVLVGAGAEDGRGMDGRDECGQAFGVLQGSATLGDLEGGA